MKPIMNDLTFSLSEQLATEISVTHRQVEAFISLYDAGNTVPFIARYRKEATSGLDDTQLRLLESRLIYGRELNERRVTILNSLSDSNKLTTELRQKINTLTSKQALERLYSPFKNKRVSLSEQAIIAGIAPFSDFLWFHIGEDKLVLAAKYINKEQGFSSTEKVFAAAQAVLIDRINQNIDLLEYLYSYLYDNASIISKVVKGQERQHTKFKDYFDFAERINKVPAHRVLALIRGKSEGALKLKFDVVSRHNNKSTVDTYINLIARFLGFSLHDDFRYQIIKKAWQTKLSSQLQTLLLATLKEQASNNAINIFASNLKDLLMAAPAGDKVILGLDPGFKSGCKIAVIDKTGKLLDHSTIYPHPPASSLKQAEERLITLLRKYSVELIAIGNGTASRETDSFVRESLAKNKLEINQVIVSEAGASVYSASELAAIEFPDLDVTFRGAVSIARRLQDPLSELVKIDANAIGVGLYQHDLNKKQLSEKLESVVIDCVNSVGVDLNNASKSLLSYVAGLNSSIAQSIIDYRNKHGQFTDRMTLKKIARLGDKTFQQCAGFLRIKNALNPLDNTGVHPESYALVKSIAKSQRININALINNKNLLQGLTIKDHVSQQYGQITVQEIIGELIKPNRDPRPKFTTITYTQGINEISDLSEGIKLQGVISNVTTFGAFVDIGVHQDGLVHVSQLTDSYVSDPFSVVKVGDIVEVKVLEVDLQRKRIALTMRL